MPLLSVVFALVIVGLILYLITLLPLDGTIKTLIHVVVIVFVILWLLQVLFGAALPVLPLR